MPDKKRKREVRRGLSAPVGLAWAWLPDHDSETGDIDAGGGDAGGVAETSTGAGLVGPQGPLGGDRDPYLEGTRIGPWDVLHEACCAPCGMQEAGVWGKLGKMAGAAALSACAAGKDCPPEVGRPTTDVDVATAFIDDMPGDDDGHGHDHEICDDLPDDGPCSLACDPEQLAQQYGHPGACVTFGCTTTGGENFPLHVCAPAEDPDPSAPDPGIGVKEAFIPRGRR